MDEICDEAELVELLRAGDLEVLDRVTRCFGDRLTSQARRRCRNDQEADDAVQDAALAAWRYGPGFRGEGSVDGWLIRLVASACTRMRRGLKNQDWAPLDDAELAAEDDPETLAARSQLAMSLAAVLEEIPPQDRAIVLLADGQGWSASEIAAVVGGTPGSVRTRLSRAHRRLRVALGSVGYEPLPNNEEII
jgi:RNA polymerase sigma-70 factor, ECF subfamily